MTVPSDPYRGARLPEATSSATAAPARRVVRRRFVAALGLVAAGGVLLSLEGNKPRGALSVPEALRGAPTLLVLGGDPLPPSTPLAPLLVRDQPSQLAVLEPAEGATRFDRGDAVAVRFNRPIVASSQIGRPLERAPLEFTPPVRGVARWTSRSTLRFAAEEATWDRTLEARMRVAAGLRALSGEALEAEVERVVVFDGSPRVVGPVETQRVSVGSPLRLLVEGNVDLSALGSQLFAYELGGGLRSLSVRARAAGRDERGRRVIDLLLSRSLEAGARVGVAYAPGLRADRSEGEEQPGTVSFEFAPPPQIEGVLCGEDAGSASECSFGPRPGRVVDVRQVLRVLASEALHEDSAAAVRVSPTLPGLSARVRGRLLELRGEWAADQVYELSFGALRTASGSALRAAAPLAVRSVGLAPAVTVASGRLTWERDSDGALPFAAVNARQGSLRVEALDEEGLVAALLNRPRRRGVRYRGQSLHEAAPSERPNRWGRGRFAWATGGDAALVDLDPDGPGLTPTRTALAQRTDVALSALAVADGLLAWVTSLRGAAPVAGARVSVFDELGVASGSAETDADGVAWVPLPARVLGAPMALIARAGGDRAGMFLDRRVAQGAAAFGLAVDSDRGRGDAPVAAVILDRGAVRPGERVRAKVIARVARGGELRALARRRVRLSLRGPSGELASTNLRLSRGGTGDAEFDLPRSAVPGSYSVAILLGGDAPLGQSSFEVAEFRPPTARVDLALARADFTDGDEVQATLRARYLFGAPISSASVRWTLRRLGAAEVPARWRAFTFGPVDAVARPATLDSGEGTVDREGVLRLSTRVRHELPMRQRASLEVSVRDASGQETSARQTLESAPAAHEVALRTLEPWIAHGEPIAIDAVVLGHDGSPAPGVRTEVKVYREAWHGYYQWAGGRGEEGDEGAWRARREQQRELVHSYAFDSTADVHHGPWTPTIAGTYVIEASVVDGAGHRSVSSQRVYAAGPLEHPDRDPPGAPFALTPARVEWTVGERAALAFECPWPEAEALIAVTQAGVVHRERRRVRAGSVSLSIPVSAAMVPNAFVTVSLVRPRTGTVRPTGELDLGSPDVRWGATELRVRPPVAPLDVTVRAPREGAPGGNLEVEVDVRDGRGQGVSAEVLLYAVDEGVLRLTRYETPDPARTLLPRRAPTFSLEDLRRTLVSRVALPALPGVSGDGSDAGEIADESARDTREEFDPTPLWLPRLRSDGAGVARATLRLPQRAGQYRVMALAVGEGLRAGRATTLVTARRDVALRALAPRALTEGDAFEAAALLNNTTERPVDATLALRVNGAVRSTRAVHLDPAAELRVGEVVEAGAGPIELAYELSVGADRAVERRVIPVAPRSYLRRRSVLGAHERQAVLTLRRPEGSDRPATALTVSTQPFLGLDAAVEALDDDALGGTAALASRVIAWSALARMDTGRGAQWSASQARARGEVALRALAGQQRADGGFGSWGPDSTTVPFLTALSLRAFGAARRAGWSVDGSAQLRASASLGAWVRARGLGRYGADELAFALRALHDVGADQASVVTQLFDAREVLRAQGLAELAMAMMPDDPRRATLLVAAGNLVGAPSSRRVARPSFFDSQSRTIAAVLEAAVRADRVELAREAAQQLLAVRAVGADAGWGDPLATAVCVEAMGLYAARFGEGRSLRAEVRLDGRPLRPSRRDDATARFEVPTSALSVGDHRLQIDAGEGTFFTALDGVWREPIGEAERVARGRVIALHRALETESGRALDEGASVRLGELVRVRLWAYSERRSAGFLVVSNRHGGGFDAVDQGLDTTPQASIEALLGMSRDDAASDPRVFHAFRSLGDISSRRFYGGAAEFRLDHGLSGLREYTYALRATTPGRFMLPPAELRALYDDATVARSTVTTLVVTR
ncbi:MAG: MG2 domain-containing protein [Polyangiales bacterium]